MLFTARRWSRAGSSWYEALKGLKARATSIPMISTVTGEVVQDGSLNATYWGRNVREPVRFADVIARIIDGWGDRIRQKSVLIPFLRPRSSQCASHRDRQVSVLCSLRRGQEERLTMLTALGELYGGGRNIDWGLLYPPGGTVVKLPSYPWQRERYWIDEQTTHSSTEKLPMRPVQGEIEAVRCQRRN